MAALALPMQAAPVRSKPVPVVKDGTVIRTQQQDAELRDWIVGMQTENALNGTRATKAEESEKNVRVQLGGALHHADVLQVQVDEVTADRNKQASLKDAALVKMDYWHQKHSEAVGKLWWWRLWGGAGIVIGILLIAGGLLIRFTAWGAKTLGPYVVKAAVP